MKTTSKFGRSYRQEHTGSVIYDTRGSTVASELIHLHASIRSTVEFNRLTMLPPRDFFSVGGATAGVADCPLPFLVLLLLFRLRLPLPCSEFRVEAKEISVVAEAAGRGWDHRQEPSVFMNVWPEGAESPPVGLVSLGLSSVLCAGLFKRGSSLKKEGRLDPSAR